ncbi:uncharacterized protein LOC110840902 [Zootermopsis nevadensis]|uniref:uncharacterized protein LOC110840902 n=1 Tax=Zootermopsis nevadensis TaxID=136037 RepID=UPI000B8E7FAA|nr:uncharacterized protein LOC110840902 [Zootermopsis nevadensis]
MRDETSKFKESVAAQRQEIERMNEKLVDVTESVNGNAYGPVDRIGSTMDVSLQTPDDSYEVEVPLQEEFQSLVIEPWSSVVTRRSWCATERAVERQGETLIVRFPVADHFECTEQGCRSTFRAASWTATRRSLERHLEKDHNIRIRATANICWDAAGGFFAYRCEECEETYPTKRGLQNHQQWHRDQARRAQCTVTLPRPQTGRSRRQGRDQPPRSAATAGDSPVPAAAVGGNSPGAVADRADVLAAPASERAEVRAVPATDSLVSTTGEPDSSVQTPHTIASDNVPPAVLTTADGTDVEGTPPPDPTRATARQLEWVAFFNNVESAAELDDALLRLEEEAKNIGRVTAPRQPTTRYRQPAPNPAPRSRRRPTYDAEAASRIQRLYRRCRPRAFREITEATSPFCQIPAEDLHMHFSRVYRRGPQNMADVPEEVPRYDSPAENDRNPFADSFTASEVWKRLRRCKNTAPGPDGIRYSVWKKFDAGGHILAAVFNGVTRLAHIPRTWTTSQTILLYKKGDKTDITNWRPIALSNTSAKVYASVLAERLGAWAARNQRISPSQKGFLPMDGCAEHNFVLQSVVTDARQNRKQCCIAWLDLTNAFNSVPHETIFTALQWAGLDSEAIEVVRRLYAGNTTTIRSCAGYTPAVDIGAGVKQGCPLSPIIFNLAFEPILRALSNLNTGYQLHQEAVHSLAYADDLALVARTPVDLQRLLDVVLVLAKVEDTNKLVHVGQTHTEKYKLYKRS